MERIQPLDDAMQTDPFPRAETPGCDFNRSDTLKLVPFVAMTECTKGRSQSADLTAHFELLRICWDAGKTARIKLILDLCAAGQFHLRRFRESRNFNKRTHFLKGNFRRLRAPSRGLYRQIDRHPLYRDRAECEAQGEGRLDNPMLHDMVYSYGYKKKDQTKTDQVSSATRD